MPSETALPTAAGRFHAGIFQFDSVQRNRNRLTVQIKGAIIQIRIGQADLVFDLNRYNGTALPIQHRDVLHKSTESMAIRFQGCIAQRRKGSNIHSVRSFGRTVCFRMEFNPFRNIIGMSVFVESEPKRNQADTVFPASSDKIIQIGKIKYALLRFTLKPVNRSFQNISMEKFESRHFTIQHFWIACGRVTDLQP